MWLKYKKSNKKRKAGNFSASTAIGQLLSAYSHQEKGTVLIVALGIGFLLTFAALGSILSSSENKLNTASQESKSRAMQIAEGAVSRYVALINENRGLATYCANASADTSCSTGTTWSNITASVIDAGGGGGGGGGGACSSSSGTTTEQAVIDYINATASSTTSWQSLGSDGEYRLISYIYQPDVGSGLNEAPGTATLTVEGRRIGVDDAVSRLTVKIPITIDTGFGGAGGVGPAGLWSYDFDITDDETVTVAANVKDSSQCYDSDNDGSPDPSGGRAFNSSVLEPLPSGIPAQNPNPNPPSDQGFPSLPNNGTYDKPTVNVNNIGCVQVSGGGLQTFPRNGDIDSNGVAYPSAPADATYTYILTGTGTGTGGENCEGLSVTISGSSTVRYGQSGQEKIYFYADDRVELNGDSGMAPATVSGNTTNVVYYVNADMAITGDGRVYNPKFNQFYVYGSRLIEISGSAATYGFVFAPESRLELSGSGGFYGALWIERYQSSGDGRFYQGLVDADFADLEVQAAGGGPTNQLSAVSSWQRVNR